MTMIGEAVFIVAMGRVERVPVRVVYMEIQCHRRNSRRCMVCIVEHRAESIVAAVGMVEEGKENLEPMQSVLGNIRDDESVTQ